MLYLKAFINQIIGLGVDRATNDSVHCGCICQIKCFPLNCKQIRAVTIGTDWIVLLGGRLLLGPVTLLFHQDYLQF